MSYNVNGTIVRLGEGEGIFVNARQLHYGFSEERTECDFLCALLHPLSFCGGNGFAEKYILPTIGGGCPFLTFRRGGTLGELYEAVSALYELRKRPSFALHALGIGYGIWAALYGLPQIRQSARRPQYADLPELKGMLTYIHKHYDEKLTPEKIAAAGSMCKSSCAAVFKKYLRKTPVRYLIEYRLKKAAEQLTRTDKKIIEIGLEAGFSGVSYFIEAFRKQYGICPSEYKKRAGMPRRIRIRFLKEHCPRRNAAGSAGHTVRRPFFSSELEISERARIVGGEKSQPADHDREDEEGVRGIGGNQPFARCFCVLVRSPRNISRGKKSPDIGGAVARGPDRVPFRFKSSDERGGRRGILQKEYAAHGQFSVL